MKLRTLLAISVLAGCGVSETSTTTLVPLTTTTEAPKPSTLPSENLKYTRAEFAFFDDVVYFYDGVTGVDDDTMLEFGHLWCDLMVNGMTNIDVVSRINEGASDEADRLLHFSIVLAGIENLCPSQKGEAWYIENNFPNT